MSPPVSVTATHLLYSISQMPWSLNGWSRLIQFLEVMAGLSKVSSSLFKWTTTLPTFMNSSGYALSIFSSIFTAKSERFKCWVSDGWLSNRSTRGHFDYWMKSMRVSKICELIWDARPWCMTWTIYRWEVWSGYETQPLLRVWVKTGRSVRCIDRGRLTVNVFNWRSRNDNVCECEKVRILTNYSGDRRSKRAENTKEIVEAD